MMKKAVILSGLSDNKSYSGKLVVGIGYYDPTAEELKETGRGFSRGNFGELIPDSKRVNYAYSNGDLMTLSVDLSEFAADDNARIYRCEVNFGNVSGSGFLVPTYKFEALSGQFNYRFTLPSPDNVFEFYRECPDEVVFVGIMDNKDYYNAKLTFPMKLSKDVHGAVSPEYRRGGKRLSKMTVTTTDLLEGEEILFSYVIGEEMVGGG